MPRYGSKKKFVRKRFSKSTKPHPTVKKLARRVKKLENEVEVKYADVYTTTSWISAPQTFGLNDLAQGDNFDQRVGETVYSKSLDFGYAIVNTTDNAIGCRIVIFWDTANVAGVAGTYLSYTGATPTNTQLGIALLDNTIVVNGFLSPKNKHSGDRFHILYDKSFYVNPAVQTGQNGHMMKSKRISLMNCKVPYDSSNGTTVGLPTRALNVMFFSNTSTGTDVSCSFWGRYTYSDA